MNVHPVFQAAVEYGVTNSAAAARVQAVAKNLADKGGEVWGVVAADPVLVAGLVVVAVLAALVMRRPAR